jgi:hypothetical protein
MLNSLLNGLKGLIGFRIKPQDAPPNTSPLDSYSEKLLKYIPADIVSAWLALVGILTQAVGTLPHWLSWSVFGALLSLTPFYVCYLKTPVPGFTSNKLFHWITACIAFSTWVFAMGGLPFVGLSWYKPVFGSLALIFVTLLLPVLERFFVKAPPAGSGTGGTTTGGSPSPPTA